MSKEHLSIHGLLQKYFGYSSFRPLQEEIIREVLDRKDVFALLPTGGGKSLCFQLPALALQGLTVVVSPLIALMKDQVDSLQAAGVAATYLNSSLSPEESRTRLRGLHRGEFKLLYLAPERLVLSGMMEDLKTWKVSLIAIDEAHCISEWGHDFRPEYRQLAQLRATFSSVPFLALTATATQRVREDILHQLRLRQPREFVASFNRPNLLYRVVPKQSAYDQLLELARSKRKESGIVYCQSRRTAESVATRLQSDGLAAAPYHAGLEPSLRARHQEQFLRDEVRIICATIAFGMGINKPNVRYVVHYDLPKNIEGYYQETGRAGRDGLPSECLLLYSPGDVVKCERFIAEKPDVEEQDRARAQLRLMSRYAESPECRRKVLLEYFGESVSETTCGGCDNCLNPRAAWEVTIAAQKLLSCVYRIQAFSGYSMGLQHVVDVLSGGATQRIRDLGHDRLSTYAIGKEYSRNEWMTIGRELIRLGYLQQASGKFATLELTAQGSQALKNRTAVVIRRPHEINTGGSTLGSGTSSARPPKYKSEGIACDEVLFERLRDLRKQLADERDVPAYIILSDVALRQMARQYPLNDAALLRINGIGEKKLKDFGSRLVAVIASHLEENPRKTFTEEAPPATIPKPNASSLSSTVRETLNLFRLGKDIDAIAQQRSLAASTIFSHLSTALEAGEPVEIQRILPKEAFPEIESVFKSLGHDNLTAVMDRLGGKYNHGQLRLVRAHRLRLPSSNALPSFSSPKEGH